MNEHFLHLVPADLTPEEAFRRVSCWKGQAVRGLKVRGILLLGKVGNLGTYWDNIGIIVPDYLLRTSKFWGSSFCRVCVCSVNPPPRNSGILGPRNIRGP